MPKNDLAKIAAKWATQCGTCDAGLPMACTCPTGDPRPVISQLINEIRELRAAAPHIANQETAAAIAGFLRGLRLCSDCRINACAAQERLAVPGSGETARTTSNEQPERGGPWTRHGHDIDGITIAGAGRPPRAIRAADLPEGSIVALRHDVWIKQAESGNGDAGPWDGTGSRWSVADELIDQMIAVGARVVRYGYEGGPQ